MPCKVKNIDSCTDETGLEDDDEVDELNPSEDEEARLKKKQKKRPSDVEVTAYIFIIIPPPPTAHVRGKSAKPPVEQHRKRRCKHVKWWAMSAILRHRICVLYLVARQNKFTQSHYIRGIHSRLKRQFESPFEKAVEIFLGYAFSI